MKKVFQTIIDEKFGNCWAACMATMLRLELDEVPNFVAFEDTFKEYDKFLLQHGYVCAMQMVNPRRLKHFGQDQFDEINNYTGINGLFKACVYSPKYFTPVGMLKDVEPTHAVVINKQFQIVHDPNPNYADIKAYPLADILGYNGIVSFDCITTKNE